MSYSLLLCGRGGEQGSWGDETCILLPSRAEQDTRGNYWRHGETDGAGQASGQYSRPVSQAIKRPLWADRRTHRGLCSRVHKRMCVFVCLFVCACGSCTLFM